MSSHDACSTHFINGDGVIDASLVEHFVKSVKLSERDLSYAVLAIMGPQSSGKSTLLNHLFSTRFDMMDSTNRRRQTTQGIWMAKAVNIEPLTIIMDIEGNDGQERGEGHSFERQTALFALAVADVVMINMWHNDIGRENGANKPLLRTVFEAMLKLFSPRKTTLLFVIRDRNPVPSEIIEYDLLEIVRKIWKEVPKPHARMDAVLEEFFIVKVITLPHFVHQNDLFIQEVSDLRSQFTNSIAPRILTGECGKRVPGSGFALSVQNIWKVIRSNKDLDLPTHKMMVATVRCEAIANEKFINFCEDKGWKSLKVDAKSGVVSNFGKQVSSIITSYLSSYDKDALYFEKVVRDAKRGQLEAKILEVVKFTYDTLLSHHFYKAKKHFETRLETALRKGEGFVDAVGKCKKTCMDEFDKHCADITIEQATNWDVRKLRDELMSYIETCSSSLQRKELSKIVSYYEKNLTDAIKRAGIESILVDASINTWPRIREILKHETEVVASKFLSSILSFKLDSSTSELMLQSLRDFTRTQVVKTTRDEADKVLTHMIKRFSIIMYCDQDNMSRNWTAEVDIKKIAEDARLESLKILSVMTVVRLQEKSDNIEKILFSSLIYKGDPLISSSWEETSTTETIFSPSDCQSMWKQFLEETNCIVTVVTQLQETNVENDATKALVAKAEVDLALAKMQADVNEKLAAAAIERANAEVVAAIAKGEADLAAAIARGNQVEIGRFKRALLSALVKASIWFYMATS